MTVVKICGLTNLEDAHFALQAGADMLGFVFYEPSPRYVSPELVKKIVSSFRFQVSGFRLNPETQNPKPETRNPKPETRNPKLETRNPKLETLFVGVFVNRSPEAVRQILDFCRLDLAQLHGDEPPDYLRQLNGRAYKAINPPSLAEAEKQTGKFIFPPSSFILLDAFHPALPGGTGHTADWTMAAQIARQHKLILAGGLSPDNVTEAIRRVKPWGVDVSSGVEAEKGKKDPAKLKAFINAVRMVDSRR